MFVNYTKRLENFLNLFRYRIGLLNFYLNGRKLLRTVGKKGTREFVLYPTNPSSCEPVKPKPFRYKKIRSSSIEYDDGDRLWEKGTSGVGWVGVGSGTIGDE